MDIRTRLIKRALGMNKMAEQVGWSPEQEAAEVATVDANRERDDKVKQYTDMGLVPLGGDDAGLADDVSYEIDKRDKERQLSARGPQETESAGAGGYKPVPGTAGTPHAEEINAQVDKYHDSWRGKFNDYWRHHKGQLTETGLWGVGGAAGSWLLARLLGLKRGGRLLWTLLGGAGAGALAAYNNGLLGGKKTAALKKQGAWYNPLDWLKPKMNKKDIDDINALGAGTITKADARNPQFSQYLQARADKALAKSGDQLLIHDAGQHLARPLVWSLLTGIPGLALGGAATGTPAGSVVGGIAGAGYGAGRGYREASRGMNSGDTMPDVNHRASDAYEEELQSRYNVTPTGKTPVNIRTGRRALE